MEGFFEVFSRYSMSKCTAFNPKLKLELKINHTVDSFLNIFIEKVLVNNLSEKERDIRVFFSHDFISTAKNREILLFMNPSTSQLCIISVADISSLMV